MSSISARTGWVTFAGIIALVAGGYNALGGLAALIGFINSFRMARLPDPVSSSSVEGVALA